MPDTKIIAGDYEVKIGNQVISTTDCKVHPDHEVRTSINGADRQFRYSTDYQGTVIEGTMIVTPEIDVMALRSYEGPVKVRNRSTNEVYAVADGVWTDGIAHDMKAGTAPFKVLGGLCNKVKV